ncbi:anthocyanidin 3-O-glucosyltransferase 2-like [Malania oleifera]|uniref:anthocyanidin 3-O-glucosyltransferase 2-like n=1 Tax=Malania oleifera TaxID=397392 RepID=UPI0025AE72F2|nr:anthocyanidin 3-O-glucosyltransferase 2-like [Malania oleifera]
MKKAQLIFVPFPFIGHLVSMVETAKLLVHRYDHLSITVFLMKLPSDPMAHTYAHSLRVSGLNFITLPQPDPTPELTSPKSTNSFLHAFVTAYIPHLRSTVAQLIPSAPLAGFVLDMTCMPMIDVPNELGLPSYGYVPSSAALLGTVFHLQSLRDDHRRDVTEFAHSDAELAVPCFANPVPAAVLPSLIVDDHEGGSTRVLANARRLRDTKGILVNTCAELETYAVNSLKSGAPEIPPVYPVGPMLNLTVDAQEDSSSGIMTWLDNQPPSSVVFLCFGSMGSFGADQLREIAGGLERSGHRFLWSLRRPPLSAAALPFPTDSSNQEEILPEGFVERTAGIGKIIGWAPQVAVLAHRAVGGFVSHCGWNSRLESVWWGVPVAAWPMYAEQQLNAFEMVKELGLGVEIRMDYKMDGYSGSLVSAEEIEKGIRGVMEGDGEVRRKVKEMREKVREAVTEGGSSHTSLGYFVEQVMRKVENESSNLGLRQREGEKLIMIG